MAVVNRKFAADTKEVFGEVGADADGVLNGSNTVVAGTARGWGRSKVVSARCLGVALGVGLLVGGPLAALDSVPAQASTGVSVSATSPTAPDGSYGSSSSCGARITLRLSAPAPYSGVQVTYAPNTSLSTAAYGAEWSVPNGTVTFNAGEQTKYLCVSVTGDNVGEYDEYAAVNFSSRNASVSTPTSFVMILDDDWPRMTEIQRVSKLEGTSSGHTTFVFTAKLDKPAQHNVTFSLSGPCCGTTQSDDVAPVNGTVTIPAGQVSGQFPALVRADSVREATENFYIAADSLSNANPYPASLFTSASWDRTVWTIGTVVNDD